MQQHNTPSQRAFIFNNLLKTGVYLLAVIALIVVGKHFFKEELEQAIALARHNLPVFYVVFFLLEILPGQLPPELFFILYSKETTSFPAFMGAVFLLACLSYVAINISYYIGKILPRLSPGNWFEKNSMLVQRYGSLIIIFGMFIPLPSAFISMAAGYLDFPVWKFRLYTLTRFIRFFGYGAVVYFTT